MIYESTVEKSIRYGKIILIVGIVISIFMVANSLWHGFTLRESMEPENFLYPLLGLALYLPYKVAVYRRKRILEKGIRYPAKVIAMKWQGNARGGSSYRLFISFKVNGKHYIRKSVEYIKNPNYVLRSKNCSVYEYKGRYMEGDFQTKNFYDSKGNNLIPEDYMVSYRKKDVTYV